MTGTEITTFEDFQDALIEVRIWFAAYLEEYGEDWSWGGGGHNPTPDDTDLVGEFTSPQRLEKLSQITFTNTPQGKMCLQTILEMFQGKVKSTQLGVDESINMEYLENLLEENGSVNGVDIFNWFFDIGSPDILKERYGRAFTIQDIIDTQNGETDIDWAQVAFYTWAEENNGTLHNDSKTGEYYVLFPNDTYRYTLEDLVSKVEYYDETYDRDTQSFDADHYAYQNGEIVQVGATGATGPTPLEKEFTNRDNFLIPETMYFDNDFSAKVNFVAMCQANFKGRAVPDPEFVYVCETDEYPFETPYNFYHFLAGVPGFVEWAESNGGSITTDESGYSRVIATFGDWSISGSDISAEAIPEDFVGIASPGPFGVEVEKDMGKRTDCEPASMLYSKGGNKPDWGEYATYGYSEDLTACRVKIICEGQPVDIINLGIKDTKFNGSQWFFIEGTMPQRETKNDDNDKYVKTVDVLPAKDGKDWVRPNMFGKNLKDIIPGTLEDREHVAVGQKINCPEVFGYNNDGSPRLATIMSVNRKPGFLNLSGGQDNFNHYPTTPDGEEARYHILIQTDIF